MDAKQKCLLLHIEIKQLLTDRVLMRVFELEEELLEFYYTKRNIKLCELLNNVKQCAMLAYLAVIFNYINSVNSDI